MLEFITTYSQFINETLKTHDIDITLRNVQSELRLIGYDFSIKKGINGNTILVKLNKINTVTDLGLKVDVLNNLLTDRHGWFPSKFTLVSLMGMENEMPYDYQSLMNQRRFLDSVEIYYEAKYDIAVNIPSKLYHLSIQEFKNSVSKNGLIPKSKSKLTIHLDRVYLCTDIKNCTKLINRMKIHYGTERFNRSKKNKIDTKWIIYEIDTSGLDISLYKDPNYDNGYYTIDNIPSKNITIAQEEL